MDAWALISVSDKRGLEKLARYLTEAGLRLLATSSTAEYLCGLGFEVASVESLTGFGEILDGRVKTLHPLIYGGILATDQESHQAQRRALGAPDIRVVVVNLYPFASAYESGAAEDRLIEEIDIGGVSLIRAAAKNFKRVAVLVSPDQYPELMHRTYDDLSVVDRRRWAHRAFVHVAYYDAVIGQALVDDADEWPEEWVLAGKRQGLLRYGENPHQSGAYYRTGPQGFSAAKMLQGKALSYNNLADADTAVRLAYDFDEPACAVVKHQTPCAAAVGSDVQEAYRKARDADPVSIFGGIVALNRSITAELAQDLTELFLEVIIAPGVEDAARAVLGSKKNLRVLTIDRKPRASWDLKGIWGGFLAQPGDRLARSFDQFTVAAGPAENIDRTDANLAWRTAALAKSNAIVIVKDGVTRGIGSGQTNRIDAARQALERAGAKARGAVMASDGFFPFGDVMRLAQECGIAVVIEPGGSMRDEESIAVAQASGVTLMMTGERHFRH